MQETIYFCLEDYKLSRVGTNKMGRSDERKQTNVL